MAKSAEALVYMVLLCIYYYQVMPVGNRPPYTTYIINGEEAPQIDECGENFQAIWKTMPFIYLILHHMSVISTLASQLKL